MDRTDKDVFQIISGNNGTSRWVKIGAAYQNRDGSLNIILDSLPIDGKMQVRDRAYKPISVSSRKYKTEDEVRAEKGDLSDAYDRQRDDDNE